MEEGKKGCSTCGIIMELDRFQPQKNSLGCRASCKYCRHIYDSKRLGRKVLEKEDYWHRMDEDREERGYIKQAMRLYQVPMDTILELRKIEHCNICGKSTEEAGKRLCIDHEHSTNKIRGVLCNHCNSGLGHFLDSTEFLEKAIHYLNKHKALNEQD